MRRSPPEDLRRAAPLRCPGSLAQAAPLEHLLPGAKRRLPRRRIAEISALALRIVDGCDGRKSESRSLRNGRATVELPGKGSVPVIPVCGNGILRRCRNEDTHALVRGQLPPGSDSLLPRAGSRCRQVLRRFRRGIGLATLGSRWSVPQRLTPAQAQMVLDSMRPAALRWIFAAGNARIAVRGTFKDA